jgi:putative ATPase
VSDLFERVGAEARRAQAPLAERMRPRRLEDVVGQGSVLGAEGVVGRLVARRKPASLLLAGPPGSGKTTIAELLAEAWGLSFRSIDATNAGIAEVRAVFEESRRRWAELQRGTLLFVDEIHRFGKAQQDALLPAVERGLVHLVGATTEPMGSAVSPALRSRCRVVRLEALGPEALRALLERAIAGELADEVARVGAVRGEALAAVVVAAGGDARRALSILELLVTTARDGEILDEDSVRRMLAEASLPRSPLEVSELRSAWIKSMRGGDRDAAVYWLERLLRADEDPLFLTRRLLVFMSEDVGMGDARALPLAHAADETVRRVGMPEGRYALVHATIYAAVTAKSRSVADAIHAVDAAVEALPHGDVPPELHVHGAGVGSRPGQRAHGWPSGATRDVLYEPSGGGEEARLRERLRGREDGG